MPSPSRQWKWPTDSREDRARRVALSYRQLIDLALAGRIDNLAEARDRLDAHWSELKQGWVVPTEAPLNPDDYLTPAEIAELLHIESRDLRNWHARGHVRRIQHKVNGADVYRYSVEDVITYYAAKRRRR